MPLERFSSIYQATNESGRLLEPHVALDRMLELVSLSGELRQLFTPGIYRYRSLAEANEARDSATAKRMRAMRADRKRSSEILDAG